jgi:hypothetical protein
MSILNDVDLPILNVNPFYFNAGLYNHSTIPPRGCGDEDEDEDSD